METALRLFFSVLWVSTTFVNVMAQEKGPSFYIESSSRDVGKVTQGKTIKQIFAFSNKGSATLEIMSVTHS